MSTETVYYLLPELVLLVVAALIYVGGAFVRLRGGWNAVAVVALLFACLLLAEGRSGEARAALAGDLLAQYVRWLAVGVGLLLVLLTAGFSRQQHAAERVGSLVLIVVGVMLVGSARELASLFLGLELISIPTYVLLALGRRDPTSQEAATKYFLLSILSSALLLYGLSFLYGVGGSLRLETIAERLSAEALEPSGLRPLAALAAVLVFAGLAFRLAAVPFHFYAPDVYQGTNNPNAALLSVVPKVAGILVLVRVVAVGMPGLESYGWRLALIVSAVTMTLGNLAALWQDNLRRLLAYSSIAHAGYLLIGPAAWFAMAGGAQMTASLDGMTAAIFYLTVYAVATIGAFAAVTYVGRPDAEINRVDELAGLGRSSPLAAIVLAVCLFSLAGIPPLAGFWGKLTLFGSALAVRNGQVAQPLEDWFLGLAVLGVLNAAVAAAYYLRIIAVMFFRRPAAAVVGRGGIGAWTAMVVCGALVVWFGVYPPLLLRSAERATPQRAPQVVHDAVAARAK